MNPGIIILIVTIVAFLAMIVFVIGWGFKPLWPESEKLLFKTQVDSTVISVYSETGKMLVSRKEFEESVKKSFLALKAARETLEVFPDVDEFEDICVLFKDKSFFDGWYFLAVQGW